jgi:hypothetical protein
MFDPSFRTMLFTEASHGSRRNAATDHAETSATTNQEPVAMGDGKEIEDAAATPVDISDGANNAPFSNKAGTPRSKPAARKAAAVAAGARYAKPFTPRFKALTLGKSPANPFR